MVTLRELMPVVTFFIAVAGFIFSIVNWIVRRAVTTKIMDNDLRHVGMELDTLKQENKEYKKEQDVFHEKIFRRLGKIEKAMVKREAICDERHKIKR